MTSLVRLYMFWHNCEFRQPSGSITYRLFRHGRYLLLVAMLCVIDFAAIAQTQAIAPQKVIPPSPDASSLGKYGSTPVSLHTGVPDISIPIYTINEGSLTLPISLSYHASGIKVSEIASWVGLGWALNAGGVVSRSVVGRSDENGFLQTTVKSATQITESDFEFLKSFADGSGDYESDYYFYNFNGRSGKFIYKQNSISPFLIPKEPIKVTNHGHSFSIVDEFGTAYTFGQPEITEVPGYSLDVVTSSYYLTSIISADGKDKIVLSYEVENPYYDGGLTYTETIGQNCIGAGPPSNDYHTTNSVSAGRTIYPVRLSEISFSTGKVTFVKDETRSDLASSRLGEIHVFSKRGDGTYEPQPRRRFILIEDYFGSGSSSRLKLAGIEERDKSNNKIKEHSFHYIESPALPARTSRAQDWWGFFNGKSGNTSLIATQIIGFNGAPFNVGGADREPDAVNMQAATLNKIVYPTGGYTEFYYEPHYYAGTFTSQENVPAKSGETGNTTDLLQETKTFTPATSGWARVHTYCSDVTDADPFFSTVTVRKQSETNYLLNHVYSPYEFDPYPAHLEKDFWVYLEAGNTYELKVMSKGNSTSPQFFGAAFSQGTVYWDEQVTNSEIMAGGLRVKEIRDYENSTATPITKIYKYGTGTTGAGTGILLIPQYGVSNSKQEYDFEWYGILCGNEYTNTCCNTPNCVGKKMIISGTPALDLTTLNGSPVVYEQVSVFEENANSPNGKSIHQFDVQVDEFGYADKAYNNGRWQMNTSWKGGDEIWTAFYVGNTSDIASESEVDYGILSHEETIGTKVGWKVQMEGCMPAMQTQSVMFSRLYYFDVSFFSGIKKITSRKDRARSSANQYDFVETQVDYIYQDLGPLHQQLSSQVILDSEGHSNETKYWYPADYNDIENIYAIRSKHIIGIPIKEEKYKDGQFVSGKVTKLNDFGKAAEVYVYETEQPQPAPVHDEDVLVPTGYSKRMDIAYNAATHNIQSLQPTDNILTSYIWGYKSTLPIAEVRNAEIGAMTSNYTPPAHYVGANINTAGTDVPLSPTFTIPFTQNVNPNMTVSAYTPTGGLCAEGCRPPTPLLAVKLKKDGVIQHTFNCTWGTNNIGQLTLGPGVYQWFYDSNITAGGDYAGDDLDIATAYVSQRTGYKSFHTSFEENGVTHAEARTGLKVWSNAYQLNLPGYNGDYILSYWKKTGSNPWQLVEVPVTVTTGSVQTMSIGSSGSIIDEVRLMPIGATMTTYTHDPLNGLTSMTDQNNITIRYEYDDLGRLKTVKDHDNNVMKTYSYHYKQ